MRKCYYTNERNSCEIDFLLDDGEKIIPLEVKAEKKPQSQKPENLSGEIQAPSQYQSFNGKLSARG